MAGRRKSVSLLKWLVTLGKLSIYEDIIQTFHINGFFEGLQWMHNRGIEVLEGYIHSAMNGHLDILQWLDAVYPISLEEVSYWACFSGHLNIIQWVLTKLPVLPERCMFISIQVGRLDIVQFIYNRTRSCPSNGAFCALAARNKKLDILKFLRSQGFDWGIAPELAAKSHSKECLEWCIENGAHYNSQICFLACKLEYETMNASGNEFHNWLIEKGYCKCQGRFAYFAAA